MRSKSIILITVAVLSLLAAGCANSDSGGKPADRGDYEQQVMDERQISSGETLPEAPSTESPEPYIEGGDTEIYEDSLDEGFSNIEQVY